MSELSPFEAIKQEIGDLVCGLRGDDPQVSDDKMDDAYSGLRRIQCAIVRYPDGEIQAFPQLLGDGCELVLDLKRPKPEIIDIPTLQHLHRGG